MKKILRVLVLVLAVVFSLFAFACGGEDTPPQTYYPDSIEVEAGTEKGSVIYYYVDIGVTVFDARELSETIKEKVNEIEGTITKNNYKFEGERMYYTCLVVKVPTVKLDEFVAFIESQGTLAYKEVSTDDLTNSIRQAQAQYSALLQSKENYQLLLQDASLTVDERLEVIAWLESVNHRIANAEANLMLKYQKYEYSTVEIMLGKKTTFWQTFSPILFFFLIPVGVAAGILVLVNVVDELKYGKRKNKSKKEEKPL